MEELFSTEKLYLLEIENGMEYGDWDSMFKLVVAESYKAAYVKAEKFMDENYKAHIEYEWIPSFKVTLIEEVEDYKIKLEKWRF